MRTFVEKIKKPLILILISIILMILTGIANTLNIANSGPFNLVFFGAIAFALLMFLGLLGLIFVFLHDRVFTIKPMSTRIGKIKKLLTNTGIFLMALFISLTALLGVMLSYYYIRLPPSYSVDPMLQLETWTAIPPGGQIEKHHKSNTDLYYWNNSFYCIYQNSKWHLQDLDGELVIERSPDASAGSWERIASIKGPGHNDVRDPLLTEINGTLFVYFLPNFLFDPEPNTTYYTTSNDMENWTEPTEVKVNVSYDENWEMEVGWIFGRTEPITNDNNTWYVTAFGEKNGTWVTLLLETRNGIDWKEISVVYDTYPSGEPCIEFLPNGEIISTLRVGAMSSWTGYEFGTPHAGTIIATSYDNRTKWSHHADFQTRMDGARLFKLVDAENITRIFAAGRNHLGPGLVGNHLGRKRTTIYEVKEDRLIHVFDLPSNGDTAYTGVAIVGDEVYVSYYTNPIRRDLPWIVGLAFFSKSEIRMAKFSATGLINYANTIIGG